MTIRTMNRSDAQRRKRKVLDRKMRYAGPTEKYCRPKLIYGLNQKSIITNCKWYPNAYTCIFDWLQKGFLVIIDEKIGGGFEYRDFPIINLTNERKRWEDKLNMKGNNGN